MIKSIRLVIIIGLLLAISACGQNQSHVEISFLSDDGPPVNSIRIHSGSLVLIPNIEIRYDVLETHNQIIMGENPSDYMGYINQRGYQF